MEHTGAFERLQRCLAAFQRATHGAVSIQLLVTFLEVARGEGRTQVEIAKAIGLPESTSSRQLLDLGPFDRKKQPGFGLVDGRIDPMDMRVKRYMLTPRGKALAEIMAALLAGEAPTALARELAALEG
ncbi:hypothetical protein [Benzoatithermus flavus]|uniref:MarR family winged helix-turn-helix transcriptional regulator n=1 Tax=Benzoatithermus flavus TaxID=3108223 RepID=A0ABU8XRT7_9PROT